MYKCGFREAFQAVAEHEKTCSKRAPAVEAMANASDGAGSSAVRAGLPSTAADTAVQRSAAVAADSDRASKPAPLESGGQLGHYCFIGKSEPILREGTLCDTRCCCCSSAARLWLERDECGAQTVCAHRQRAGQRTSGAAGADHTWLVRARCGGARTAREDRQSGLRLALADVSVLRVRPVRLVSLLTVLVWMQRQGRRASICVDAFDAAGGGAGGRRSGQQHGWSDGSAGRSKRHSVPVHVQVRLYGVFPGISRA